MTQATRLHCRGMGSLILKLWCHAISCCCCLLWLLPEAPLPAKIGVVVSVLVGLIGCLLSLRGHLHTSEGAAEHLEHQGGSDGQEGWGHAQAKGLVTTQSHLAVQMCSVYALRHCFTVTLFLPL